MATIVRSVYNSLTREAAIEQIQEVLKAYENRIREIRHDTDRLVPEGKDIVDSYCCNEENEQVLVQKAYSDKAFFEQMPDEQVMQYYQVCRELNQILELGVEGLVAAGQKIPEKQDLLTLYHHGGNKPARYAGLNGGLSWFSSIQDFIDFLGLFGDPTVELYNEMKRGWSPSRITHPTNKEGQSLKTAPPHLIEPAQLLHSAAPRESPRRTCPP